MSRTPIESKVKGPVRIPSLLPSDVGERAEDDKDDKSDPHYRHILEEHHVAVAN